MALRNPKHEAFCQYWVFGRPVDEAGGSSEDPDTRGNAHLSYLAAGYRAQGSAARACASRLLARANIQARITELRREQERILELYLRPWICLLPQAQQVLQDAMDGKETTSQQIQAAREVIEQAQGPTRLRFTGQARPHAGAELQVTLWSGGGPRDA